MHFSRVYMKTLVATITSKYNFLHNLFQKDKWGKNGKNRKSCIFIKIITINATRVRFLHV